MSFSGDIEKFVKHAKGNGDALVRQTVLDIGTRLVERTPVGNPTGGGVGGVPPWKSKPPPGYVGGHARANWQHSVGAPIFSEVPGTDKTGGPTIEKIMNSIPKKAGGKTHYITNSVPYIERLEDGHSHQAPPNGIVGRTVVEFQGIVNAIAAGLR